MILPWLVIWFFVAGLLAWAAEAFNKEWPRWVSMITMIAHLGLLLAIWGQYVAQGGQFAKAAVLFEYDVPWIPQVGIHFHLALDGFSLLLVVLSNFLGIMAVWASWKTVQTRVGFFHFNLLWTLATFIGIFMAMDLFLFYFFWEMMLVPLYFLIGIWGYERRIYATLKFFLFTQLSGLLLLLGILGLYFIHGRNTGVYTFDYFQLLGTALSPGVAMGLMLGFAAAFAVKLPMFPFHTWLPDAHTEAPTAGSVDLAGLVLKVGAYGFIRFVIPLFPEAASTISPVAFLLGVIGILYGAIVAFGQTDIKRLVAYTSISHMSFILIGVFAWNQIALQGAVMIMIAHGISTGALFIFVGDLQARIHTREMDRMGGLWSTMPRMGGSAMVFALASLGLPGLGNFVGEFLVLLGLYQVSPPFAIVATVGFIVSTVYSLWMMRRAFFGQNTEGWKLPDLSLREGAIMAILIAVIFWLGLFPKTVLETSGPAIEVLQTESASRYRAAVPSGLGLVSGRDGEYAVSPRAWEPALLADVSYAEQAEAAAMPPARASGEIAHVVANPRAWEPALLEWAGEPALLEWAGRPALLSGGGRP
jgi:NADH-quinone oxidoreductase subunit M